MDHLLIDQILTPKQGRYASGNDHHLQRQPQFSAAGAKRDGTRALVQSREGGGWAGSLIFLGLGRRHINLDQFLD